MELLAKLGINWQLLLAQIVNFGIVLGALTLLVYRPLLNLLDERRERIRKSLEDVKEIEGQKKEMELFRLEQMKKIDQEIGQMLERSKKEAEATKQQILAAAQEESARILQRGEKQLAEERTRVLGEVQATVAQVIVRATEKILQRELSATDQKKWMADLSQHLTSDLR
ncbi:MAG: F0F1 ATP synthase subunit B [Candidatus Peribacteraceae bacterium]|nr:F0F1 ATP synthase subunit B [Candidatus Peribacteraceae bacterium]